MLINRFGAVKPLTLNVNGKEENYTVPSGKSYVIGDLILNSDDSLKGVSKTGGSAGSTITIIVPDGATGSGGSGDTICSHTYVHQYSPTNATCGDTVTYADVCTKCGDVKNSGTTVVEHTQAYTYFPNGSSGHIITAYCSRCNELIGRSQPAHTPDWKQNCGTEMKCSLCGYVMDAPTGNHNYVNGTCTVCGKKS